MREVERERNKIEGPEGEERGRDLRSGGGGNERERVYDWRELNVCNSARGRM